MRNNHPYIILSETPRSGAVTEASLLITNQFFNTSKSANQWRKDKNFYRVKGKDHANNDIISNKINYHYISEFIRNEGHFNPTAFNLPVMKSFWLDGVFEGKINFHKHDETAPHGLAIADGYIKQIFGEKYPISPKLIREGHTFTSLQPQLLQRITKIRTKLIENSADSLTDDWFFELRSLISDSISLVEITLNQIYIMAEYNPLANWNFQKEKLGERHGRRFEDKLGWIYQISGNHLGAEKYLPSFHNLRELRNHLMHFDPPSLIVTIEEATIWLNQIIDVGWLLIKMRKAVGTEISIPLINFILQKEAVFNPEPHCVDRLPIGTGNSDYISSTWPKY
ncbi:MAG TPA: hypothetical protein PLL09_00285 [Flavobacterium sp.]|uniref:hypothetical protein n=1 Tax=unclassified Flavobacterium TaxID=196869 RepID=UPI0025C2F44C|nr:MULTISPECIES: hypothetical protein [unclassified Flavobacterium]HRE76237.1 hypothetical protein [Flavobacterium sp.]